MMHACAALVAGWAVVAAAPVADVSGAQVKRAVQRGGQAIRANQRPDGTWTEQHYPGGVTCLAVFTLLQAGDSGDEPHIEAAIRKIRVLPHLHTYVVSLKIMVLAAADAEAYHDDIVEAARWLVMAQNRSGLWGYSEVGNRFDHSNSQFALLGLHAAAQAGVRVPEETWRRAQTALLRNQNADGGWAYQSSGNSYGSMTAAGVADLVILGGRLRQLARPDPENWPPPKCGQYRINRPLARGLSWLSQQFRAGTNPGRGDYLYYWLYAAERAGILSGQRFFGTHDWYRAGASVLVKTQDERGMWRGSVIDTCFAVLFLAKGHKSLLIQKLQWSADDRWSPVRYELDHLVSRIGDQLGEPVTWQSVPLDAPVEEWLAAPLLQIQGYDFPDFNEEQRDKLRRYVDQGGTIFADACCGRPEFKRGFERFVSAVFPEVPLRELGPEHALYRVVHEVEPYGLMGVDYGCRTSVIFSPRDLSCLWEVAEVPQLSEMAFELGTNIAAYAVGRRPLRDRLDVVVLPKDEPDAAQAGPPAQDALRLAQVVYEGDWRPFPQALVGLADFLRRELAMDVVPQYQQVRLTDAALRTCPILWLAGHFEFRLSPAEVRALREHLDRGGFLIGDACCGTEPFGTAFRGLVGQLYPGGQLEKLPPDHPIFVGAPGFNVTRVSYSPDVARAKPNLNTPEVWGLAHEGRLVVVYSPYSLSCGLSGPTFEGCWGLESRDARRLAANIVLYALTH